jgi:hypothetical protein
MSEFMVESTVVCPSCWEETTVLIDVSGDEHTMIEDCQVCCNPMELTFTIEDGELVSIEAERA